MTVDNDDFMKQLDEATDVHMAENEPKDDEETFPPEEDRKGEEGAGGDAPADGDDGDDADDGTDGDDGPGEDEVTDELLDRAAKAGMSVAEAKEFPTGALLSKQLTRLEAAKGVSGDDAGDGEEEVNPLDSIPDLNPDDFDEEIVKVVGALKGVVGQLFEENKRLKANVGSESSSRGTWADAKFSELGEEFGKVFGKGDAADLAADSPELLARERVERHMDYLLEDAKEAGESMTRAEAFQKALEVRHGDVIKKEKGKAIAAAASKRSSKAVNRPRNTNGQFGSGKDDFGSDDDRESDAIAAVTALFEDG